jgi:hypothetical protein
MSRIIICTALMCTMAVCVTSVPNRKHGTGGLRLYAYPRMRLVRRV